jgi:hypothetical protein
MLGHSLDVRRPELEVALRFARVLEQDASQGG